MEEIHAVTLPDENDLYVVVMTERIYKKLKAIKDIVDGSNEVVNFLLFGERKYNGVIWLDNILSLVVRCKKPQKSIREIDRHIVNLIDSCERGDYEYSLTKPVVCIGSTTDDFYFNYFEAYNGKLKKYFVFAKDKIEVFGLLMCEVNAISLVNDKYLDGKNYKQKNCELYVTNNKYDIQYGKVKILKK